MHHVRFALLLALRELLTVCVAAATAAAVEAAAAEFTVVVAALAPGLIQMRMISVVSVCEILEIWPLLLLLLLLELALPLLDFSLFALLSLTSDPTVRSFRPPRTPLRCKSISNVPAKAKGAVQRAASVVNFMMKDLVY